MTETIVYLKLPADQNGQPHVPNLSAIGIFVEPTETEPPPDALVLRPMEPIIGKDGLHHPQEISA